jgi:outer membrane lipoprotein-sorting protein
MMRSIFIFAFLSCIAFTKPCVQKENNMLSQIEVYLNQLPTIKAAFQQSTNGAPAILGTLYIDKKNGYTHIDYPSLQQKIIIRNGTLYLADATDKTVQDIDAANTPAGLLLQKNIQFNHTVHVLKFSETNETAHITLASTKTGDEGSMTIEFLLKPFLKIKGWVIFDQQGNEIHVDITKFEAGLNLDKKLFDRPEF